MYSIWSAKMQENEKVIMLSLCELVLKWNIYFHTMLPVAHWEWCLRVDFVYYFKLRRLSSFCAHRREKKKNRKPSELFNYIFMCMRLISMSTDDGNDGTRKVHKDSKCSRHRSECRCRRSPYTIHIIHPHEIKWNEKPRCILRSRVKPKRSICSAHFDNNFSRFINGSGTADRYPYFHFCKM